jgi:hypothetical protein
MRLLAVFGVAAMVMSCTMTEPVSAEPEFPEAPSAVCAGTDLVVSFERANLGHRMTVDTFTSADIELACARPGGPIRPVSVQRISAVATLRVDPEGRASGVARLRPDNPCTLPEQLVTTYRGLTVEVGQAESVLVYPRPIVCR